MMKVQADLALAVALSALPGAAFATDLEMRAVKAAETSALWAIVGVGVAVLGTILLFINLYLAAEATKAANIAAVAAKEAIDHARLSSQLELRPYMSMIEANWESYHPAGQPASVLGGWRLSLKWMNQGQTPATDTYTQVAWRAFDGEIPRNFDFPDPTLGGSRVGTVGPGGIFNSQAEIPVGVLSEVWAGEKQIAVWSWCDYDSFPDQPRHRTEHAIRIILRGDPSTFDCIFSSDFLAEFNGSDSLTMYRPRSIHHKVKHAATAPRASKF